MKIRPFLTTARLFVALAVLLPAGDVWAQISKSDVTLQGVTFGTNSLAYDTVNDVYLQLGNYGGSVRAQFVSKQGALLGSQFAVTDESVPFVSWYSVAFGGPPSDPVFLVTYLVDTGAPVPNGTQHVKYARLIRYQSGGGASVSGRSLIADTGRIYSASELGRNAWDGSQFVVGSFWLVNGATTPQPVVHHVSTTGVVSGGVVLGDNRDFYGVPSIACAPSERVCIAVGFAAGIPWNYSGGSYMRLFNADTLQPITNLEYVDASFKSEDQTVVFNSATRQFLVTWLSYRNSSMRSCADGTTCFWIDNRLISVTGTKGTYDASRAFGPGAGESRTAYNPTTGTTLLVSKSNRNAARPYDFYAVELGDSGAPIRPNNVTWLMECWNGTDCPTPAMNAGIAANPNNANWLVDMWYVRPRGWLVQGTANGTPPPPPPPSLGKSTPSSGATLTSSSATLTWGTASGATLYEYCVSTTNGSCTPPSGLPNWQGVGTSTGTTVSGLANGSYYWQVRATVNGSLVYGDSGTWWPFTVSLVVAPPSVVALGATEAVNGSWVFAEGAYGLAAGFNTYYSIVNESMCKAHVRGWLVKKDGTYVLFNENIPAQTRKTFELKTMVNSVEGEYSAVFQSVASGPDGVPESNCTVPQVYVARSTYWGAIAGQGVMTGPGHLKTGVLVAPGQTLPTEWFFGEGARVNSKSGTQFDDYYLVFNPFDGPATVTVDFYAENSNSLLLTTSQSVPARNRWTVRASDYPELNWKNFSVRIRSNIPVMVERAMYWGPLTGGHVGVGASTLATTWYFAEGTAQDSFDTYYLLLNPSSSPVTVTATYQFQLNGGVAPAPATRSYTIPAYSRRTVNIREELGTQGGVSSKFVSTGPIVAERSMYWGPTWAEGSNVIGANTTAKEWHVPEGSTANGFETYLLVSNPNSQDLSVVITAWNDIGQQETLPSPVVVPANSRLTLWMNNTDGAAGPVFSYMQNRPFSLRVKAGPATPGLEFVVEEAVYWNWRDRPEYWRGGDTTLGVPIK